MSEVIQMVAQDSEKKGLHEDAIKLYDLAKVSKHWLLVSHQMLWLNVQHHGL